jgi:hypothetical protein
MKGIFMKSYRCFALGLILISFVGCATTSTELRLNDRPAVVGDHDIQRVQMERMLMFQRRPFLEQ